MVRRSGDHEMVEWAVVERSLRHVHGDALHRRLPPRLGAMDRLRADRDAAFDTDGSGQTRPIEFEVKSPDDAEGMFDILTYEKGAAVVRMLEQHLGEDEFRPGHPPLHEAPTPIGNAETTDLWDAIEAEIGSACPAHHGQLDLPGWLPSGASRA